MPGISPTAGCDERAKDGAGRLGIGRLDTVTVGTSSTVAMREGVLSTRKPSSSSSLSSTVASLQPSSSTGTAPRARVTSSGS